MIKMWIDGVGEEHVLLLRLWVCSAFCQSSGVLAAFCLQMVFERLPFLC
jgi:hypothetical protein